MGILQIKKSILIYHEFDDLSRETNRLKAILPIRRIGISSRGKRVSNRGCFAAKKHLKSSQRYGTIRKRLEHDSNPWNKVSGQTETQPPKNDHRQKAESRFVCCNGGSCHFDPIPFGHFMGGTINEQV
jgi:hypothetical protein